MIATFPRKRRSNDQPDSGYPPQGTYANLQIVNNSWDAPPIDVLLDGQPFVTQVDYGRGTGELPITPGAHSLVVQIETSGAATTVIGPTTLDASANMDYVVAVDGDVAKITAVTLPHPLAVVPAQSVRIQVLNPLIDAPVQVYLTAPGADLASSTPLGTAPYEGSVGPTDVTAGEWEIRMTQSGGTLVYDSGTLTLQGGAMRSGTLRGCLSEVPVRAGFCAWCTIRPTPPPSVRPRMAA
jgi:hypothetical protein